MPCIGRGSPRPTLAPMTWTFDRSAYRIPYPPSARARLFVGTDELALVDCSERGVRYVSLPGPLPEPGDVITGRVRLLCDRTPIEVTGKVVRLFDREVAVELDAPGIPARLLFGEQRFLAQRFPARFGPQR